MTDTKPPYESRPDLDETSTERPRRRADLLMMGGSVLALIAATVFLGLQLADRHSGRRSGTAVAEQVTSGAAAPTIGADGSVTYTITRGTRDRILAGETTGVIPAKVTLHVGQVLTIVNDDIDTHIVGPFLIGPGESTSYSFDEPKVISGTCTLHPSGGFEIDVVP